MGTYSWKPEESFASLWPHGAAEEHTQMGQRVDQWQQVIQNRFPELLRHLVWDRDRLNQLEEAVDQVIADDGLNVAAVALYRRSLLNRLTGLGPLDQLLTDDHVTEIMVNGPQQIYCERDGRIMLVNQQFADPDEVTLLAQRLASRAGRVLNTESPLCDAQLADGSRIHCVLPPVAEKPTITIRRARAEPLVLTDLIEAGSLSHALWQDLSQYIEERRNIIIAGGAGSGKTSLLRLLASHIDPAQRVVTIEDVRELNLTHSHTVSLEATRAHDVHTLLVNALRMRPDRIIVGEVRGAEALELIEAMSTGHYGSLSTVHAQSGGMATVLRLARMCARNQLGIPFEELLGQIQDTLDVIVYVRRGPDGVRRIESVQQPTREGMHVLWVYRPDAGFVKVGEQDG
ncbi:CpaF family protein [Sulfobacillus sp. hq2]|uniref:CpaF family protein n=1 Tax=Sulfobacillus TaxID=28033 RepID=UPI001304C571|nr:ATPase, T2SS/T4P/T4SS family [Sulfobacillus sp. hq2]